MSAFEWTNGQTDEQLEQTFETFMCRELNWPAMKIRE